MLTRGASQGVEVEADKWHTNYGHLYAKKDVADPPGSNQFLLPTKLTSLLGPLEAAAAKQVGHTNSTSNDLVCQHMTTFWCLLLCLGKHRNNQHHLPCRAASELPALQHASGVSRPYRSRLCCTTQSQ